MTTRQKKFLSIRELADTIGVTYHTVWRKVYEGQIAALRPGNGKVLISIEEANRYLNTPHRGRKHKEEAPTSDGLGA